MAEKESTEMDLMRRGYKCYEVNPSLSDPIPTRIRKSKPTKMGDAYMVTPGTGQVIASGAFGFVQEKEIDSEEFVKMYIDGIRKYGELTKAGATMFEFVYHEMKGLAGKDRDTVMINFYLAQKRNPNLTRSTYFRGMGELLAKGFIFRSISADLYFVNVRFMFNGDRMVLVQSYRRKGNKNNHDLLQNELPLDSLD